MHGSTCRPLDTMRLIALPPPPPTPMTLILASPPAPSKGKGVTPFGPAGRLASYEGKISASIVKVVRETTTRPIAP